MKLSCDCIHCIFGKANELYARSVTDESQRVRFMKETMRILADAAEDVPIPYLTYLVMTHLHNETQVDDYYTHEKTTFNNLMLSVEDSVMAKISASADPLLSAMRCAITGNMIDFGALKTVSKAEVLNTLDGCGQTPLDAGTCDAFRRDLGQAKTLAYLADNAGEIVMDKLLVQVLQRLYPQLTVRFFVRGNPTLNDATLQDAEEIGLTAVTNVYTNGKAVPGTCLDYMEEDMAQMIRDSDVIISKGQGNFESLNGSGLNVYYLLLCKCGHFARRFNMKSMQPVFIHERDVKDLLDP